MSQAYTNDNADGILHKARNHCAENNFGKACSFYLYLFHQESEYCNTLKDEFVIVFTKWFEKMLLTCGVQELSSFLQTVLETCQSIKTDIVLVAAELLFQSEHVLDASKLLMSCRTTENISYRLEEHVEQLHNFLIDRWHFRMLNDKRRNLAYSLAMKKACQEGYKTILDIGSGTGILSLLAKKNGFENIYSCETSDVMCDIQRIVLASANASNEIKLLTKMSTELKVGEDLPERVPVVVTEIFDCGLLGEGVIPTLINAWEHLLLPDVGKVIPQSAIAYGICVECEELRKHSRFKMQNNIFFYGSKDPGDVNEQPYTTEHMKRIKGGYKELSKSFVAQKFDFNNPQSLKEALLHTTIVDVPITSDGIIDGIVIYFQLDLDDTIQISSSPNSDSCWEQAVYTVHCEKIVKAGTQVKLEVTCLKEFLVVKMAAQSDNNITDTCATNIKETLNQTDLFHNGVTQCKIYRTDRRLVARLNDTTYMSGYTQVISQTLDCMKQTKDVLDICMICCEVSMFPFILSRIGHHNIYLVEPSQTQLQIFLHKNMSLFEKIKILTRPLVDDLSCCPVQFDLVISEPVDYNGLIKENFIEDITAIKSLCCSKKTSYIPHKVDILAVCISSEQLLKENRVVDRNVTLGFEIDTYINEYTVMTHPDVDASSLQHEVLSNYFACGCIDLQTKLQTTRDIDAFNFAQLDTDVTITTAGKLTGLILWYDLYLSVDVRITTSPSYQSHWNQSCVIFPEEIRVSVNDNLAMTTTRNKSNLHFSTSR